MEDLPIGQAFDCGSFTLTAREIIDFAVVFDPQPWHLDDGLARETYFAGLCASGLHTQGAAIGLMVRAIADVAIVAGGSLHEARFYVPVRPDQAYRVRACWVSARPGRRAGWGVAAISITVQDAAEVTVMEGGVTYIVARGGG